jgi:hypothetical protein
MFTASVESQVGSGKAWGVFRGVKHGVAEYVRLAEELVPHEKAFILSRGTS